MAFVYCTSRTAVCSLPVTREPERRGRRGMSGWTPPTQSRAPSSTSTPPPCHAHIPTAPRFVRVPVAPASPPPPPLSHTPASPPPPSPTLPPSDPPRSLSLSLPPLTTRSSPPWPFLHPALLLHSTPGVGLATPLLTEASPQRYPAQHTVKILRGKSVNLKLTILV